MKQRKFGCCKGMLEGLMHTGDSWDYPQWYIDFLLGTAGANTRPINQRLKRYLEFLSDGKYHRKLKDGIGIGTLEAANELNLTKHLFNRKDDYIEFIITKLGLKVLYSGNLTILG